MEATHAHSGKIHDRLSEMKLRIATKKSAADMLFAGLDGTHSENTKISLELILGAIKKQQDDEGNIDSTVH